MIRLIILLSCLAIQAIVFWMFLRYKIERQLIREQALRNQGKLISIPDGQDRIVAVTGFSKRRRLALTVLGSIFIGFFLCLAAIVTFAAIPGPDDIAVSALLAIFLGVSSVIPWFLMMEAYGRFCIVTQTGVEFYLPCRKARFVKWGQIRRIWWLPLFGGFRIHTDHGLVAASSVWENIQSLADGLLRNVPENRLKWARKPLKKAVEGPFEPRSLV